MAHPSDSDLKSVENDLSLIMAQIQTLKSVYTAYKPYIDDYVATNGSSPAFWSIFKDNLSTVKGKLREATVAITQTSSPSLP